MPLPAIVETLDALNALPEVVRSEYTQIEGGKYRLNVDGAEEAFVPGLKKNRDEQLTENKKLKEQLKAYEGIDVAGVRKAQQDAEQKAAEAARKAGDWEAREKQLHEKYGTEIKSREERVTTLTGAVDKVLRQNAALAALAGHTDAPELLLPHVLTQLRVVEDPSDPIGFRTVVVDAKGNTRIANATGADMTIADLVKEMKANKTFAVAFKGSGASGSGAAGSLSTATHAAGAADDLRGLSPEQRLAVARERGLK